MSEEIMKDNADKPQQTETKGCWDGPFSSVCGESVIFSLFVNKNQINHTFRWDRTLSSSLLY